jgi:hypothetical protein
LPHCGIGVDALGVDPRSDHRHRARSDDHLAFAVIASADHQTPPVLVALIGELLDIGTDSARSAAANI